jgi:hypothetical protein
LDSGYNLQSVWKIAELAIMCVKPKSTHRPLISEVLKEIQDAIAIEQGPKMQQQLFMSNKSMACSNNTWDKDEDLEQNAASFDELLMRPGLR